MDRIQARPGSFTDCQNDILDYLQFREKIEEHFIHSEPPTVTSNDDDSDYDPDEPALKRSKARVSHPSDKLRTKNVLHLPEFPTPVTKNRCRFPGCSANKVRIRCSTCKVFLCLQETRNCFQMYHEL